MVRFTLRLDKSLHQAAGERAAERGQTLAGYIKELISRDIEQSQPHKVLLYIGDNEIPLEVVYEYV